MMRFDSDSLSQRKLSLLNENPDWKPMINNSVISSMVRHDAEIDAELARYMEYLFNEARMDTAQNRSSVVSIANMFGYQPKRKVSAHGKLYVSIDSKITYVPTTITMDSLLSLKDESSWDSSTLYKSWKTNESPIIIDPSCTVKDSNGTPYVVVSSTTLKAKNCLVSIDVMQGVRKTKFLDINTIRQIYSRSLLNRCLYIPVKIKDCEAASTISSKALLNVYVVTKSNSSDNNSNTEKLESYRIVDSLLLSSDGDKDVEFYNDLYNQDMFYLKFRDDPYHGGTLDLSSSTNIIGIRIDYVESLGKASNLNNLYETFYIDNAKIDSGSSNNTNIRLFGINYSPMEGGADEESIAEIKKNAVREYIKYYGVATKENYQRVILNTEFPINIENTAYTIIPKKVQVYGGYEEQGTMRNPVTNISFIGTNLEDNITGKNKELITRSINDSLNYCLSRLKSPQDTLRFVPPIYTSFAVGVKCKLRKSDTDRSQNIASSITDYIENNWGPNSSSLDFGRDFYKSAELSNLYQTFDTLRSVSMEIEAVKKLNWEEAERVNPWGSISDNVSSTDNSTKAHTCRIPFEFSTVFKGSLNNKEGFKDYNTASSYVMRIDFLYKAPTALGGSVGLNRTIFLDSGLVEKDRSKTKFYRLVESKGSENLWPEYESLISSSNYDELGDADELPSSYIVDFKKKVYDDSDYLLLKKDILEGKVATRNSTSRGTIDSYLVYFSGDYTTETGGDGNIGAGWLEIPFDEIYGVLEEYALYDDSLRDSLRDCQLSILKCDTTNSDAFRVFKSVVSDYLDIYVSMRPNDSDLVLQSALLSKESGFNGSNEILYIDSYDSPISEGEKVTNLTSEKRARFISVECSYATY